MSSLGNTFSNIANSIRNVSESSDLYTPLEMSNVINNIITDKEWEQIGWDDDRKNVPWVTLFQKVEGTSNVTKSISIFHISNIGSTYGITCQINTIHIST